MKKLAERKYLVLLLLLIPVWCGQPLAHYWLVGGVVYDALATLTVLFVFLVVFERKRERMVALGIVLLAIASNWMEYALTGNLQVAMEVVRHSLYALFLGFAVTVILRGLFEQRVIRADQIIGAVCGYLIAGVAWGNLYSIVNLLVPGSFSVKGELAWQLANEDTRHFLFNYYSFTTLTTLGYGDITPVRPEAAGLAWLEAVFGQFYLAVIVAQLIGLKLAQAVQENRPDQQEQ